MRLCVTADDYGLSAAGNDAIGRAAPALGGVSVMVHAEARLDGVGRLGDVPLGLHLCLTRERPLSPEVAASALVDGEGRLPRGWARLFATLLARPRLRALVAVEVAAQLARFAALARPLAFVNSHEHVHLFPLLWPVIAALIPPGVAVRTAARQPLARPRQSLLALASRWSWARAPLARPTLSPLGVDDSGRVDLRALPRLLALARRVRAPALPELVLHPSDVALLASPQWPALLARHDVDLARAGLA